MDGPLVAVCWGQTLSEVESLQKKKKRISLKISRNISNMCKYIADIYMEFESFCSQWVSIEIAVKWLQKIYKVIDWYWIAFTYIIL